MSSHARDPSLDEVPEYLEEQADVQAPADVPKTGLLRFARMAGSSIAGRDGAFWVTDFLNAAYYRRPAADRDVDDLRLAFCLLTTYWYRKPEHRRLRVSDLPAFHRAFGSQRFATKDSASCTLNREQLLEGAAQLLGKWFPAAYADDQRRGWGVAFETVQERDAYDPDCRMKLARVSSLTPERAPLGELHQLALQISR
jgi:hypothetical protein